MTAVHPIARSGRRPTTSVVIASLALLLQITPDSAQSADRSEVKLVAATSALTSRSVRSPARISRATPAARAGSVVLATRSLPSRTVLQPGDLRATESADPDMVRMQIESMVGRETLVAVPSGGALGPEDVGDPALVERNELVTLSYTHGGLTIRATGRALDRGSRTALVRAMNLDSRRTVTGRVTGKGLIEVSQP